MRDFTTDDARMFRDFVSQFKQETDDVYLEKLNQEFEIGTQATYDETGEIVNVVEVDSKSKTAIIELPDESRVYNVSFASLNNTL